MNKKNFFQVGVLLILTLIFGLFAYNSDFGYDALEYLVIGRSMNDGYEMYDFIPSKSWLWYVFVQHAINLLGGDFTHFQVTLLITLLFSSIGISTFYVVDKISKNQKTAFVATFLTLLSCFFMEMNFLEPEAPIAVLAIWSCFFLSRNTNTYWLFGGILLGIAMCFKSIAMFYVAGAGFYLLYECFIIRQSNFWQITQKGTLFILGFTIPLGLSLLYFYSINRLEQHIYWSYIYPFGSYPAHTIFLKKLLTKTFWLLLLTFFSLLLAFYHRKHFFTNFVFSLSVFLGIFSLTSLLKSQASHYLFPAAPFFSIIIAMVYSYYSDIFAKKIKQIYLFVGSLALLVAIITFISRPDVIKRLFHVNDFAIDKTYNHTVNRYLKKGDKALLIDFGSLFYFHSHVYPNVPFINTEMQTSDYIKRHVNVYEKSLQDTSLKLVIFGYRPSVIDDSSKVNTPENKEALDKLRKGLQEKFIPEKDSILYITLWHRKPNL
ncbi:glycosyltransferase family 39 protein [Emticicia sp. SJ17W-69]|uniref:glycosyltransferase family 39 protein n=1 Tax=Emticicia sp. SJ17W-69 TaxID=3421657 RepID=UPI003EBBF049